ncbi:hypothetical protein [Flaviflexus massiliensis]|uniref:hypothetical protein n=1 Tax=Flaviflexus massiliensis TaxID=1522309 RepID=UPI0006D53DB8|nr:hypothetical protein [Flaviflexus massiliensis]
MDIVIAIVALLFSAVVGWPVVEGVFALVRVVPEEGRKDNDLVIELPPPARKYVLLGGSVIGILERLSTTGLVLVGQPGLIAVVVAIKSLGRWAELQEDPAINERFIIGSLASYLWAGLCGFVALQIMN